MNDAFELLCCALGVILRKLCEPQTLSLSVAGSDFSL
jgi:hypothetical protein